MDQDYIKIKQARMHNLKSVDLEIPKEKLVVITGVSGSGKSSLAFDTLYAEGQRRYVESLSAYARQFLGVMKKPDCDNIEGLSPAIAIEHKPVSKNPRSTVGTVTEVYDYLRLLYARLGTVYCPSCGQVVSRQTPTEITNQILATEPETRIDILGPVIRGKKGQHKSMLEQIKGQGFVKVRIDGEIKELNRALREDLERYKKHTIEVLVDRLKIPKDLSQDDKERVRDSVEQGLKIGNGILLLLKHEGNEVKEEVFSEKFACPDCEISIPEIEPRTFSFNSPYGACPKCNGLGEKVVYDEGLIIPERNRSIGQGAIKPWATASHRVGRQGYYWSILSDLATQLGFSFSTPWKDLSREIKNTILYGSAEYGFEGVIPNLKRRYRQTSSEHTRREIGKYTLTKTCPACKGARLKKEALSVKIGGKNIVDVAAMSLERLRKFISDLSANKDSKYFDSQKKEVAAPILKELATRVKFLNKVGLSYLTLSRKATTLSSGESQRIRLATQIGSGLTGVLYILDEPTIGLHQRDQGRLLETLKHLRDLGNTVIVVEHDAQTILAADWVIDLGPGAGKNGGEIVGEGTPAEIAKMDTATGRYLREYLNHDHDYDYDNDYDNDKEVRKKLEIKGACEHNLKNIDVEFPLEKFICVTGVSGSGKSTLVNDTLARALFREFYSSNKIPGKFDEIKGMSFLNKVINVDQSPIGRTPRSNPATYTKVFTPIREIFAQTKEAKIRGYDKGRFSFNVKGGRCEACQGQGSNKVEMQFLPDVYVECDQCHGARYNQPTLEVEYKGKNIAQVLEMTVDEAAQFFKNIPKIKRRLKTLQDVGLGYIELGQPATTLSGGEAQRIKLARELSKVQTTDTFYILDEPTTGLHHEDIKKLLSVLEKLVDRGNTVLIIEHNLDVISRADWIIDLGPEGGKNGGEVVTCGPPAQVAQDKKSYTGRYLKKYFNQN